MSKNITLKLNESILRKARHSAVEQDKSLSQWVADLITQNISREEQFNTAKKRALKRLDTGFHLGGNPFSRDKIYER